jgi:hypothetical protein
MDDIGWSLTENQRKIVVDLFFHTGIAESCYSVGCSVFSVAKQMEGPAIGFIQIEPETAHSVLEQSINAANGGSPLYSRMNEIVDLKAVLDWIKRNPIGALNDMEMSLLIFRLKLGNIGFRGVPGFRGSTDIEPSLANLGKTWKKIWNTDLGAGTVEGFLEKNKIFVTF